MTERAFVRPQIVPNITRKMNVRSKQRQGNSNKSKSRQEEPQGELVILKPSINVNRIVRRKFRTGATISSTAGGVISFATISVSQVITALGSEFTNFAQEYLEYRVMSIRRWFIPSTTNATSTTGPYQGGVVAGAWQQLTMPSSVSLLQSNELVEFSTLEEKKILVLPRFTNSKLWNAYGVAYPADRDFGLAWYGVGTLAVSSQIFAYIDELHVEFQMPQ